jgi:hypothetical protein
MPHQQLAHLASYVKAPRGLLIQTLAVLAVLMQFGLHTLETNKMKIIITRDDGGISIMNITTDVLDVISGAPDQLETIIEIEINQWAKGSKLTCTSWRVLNDNENLPEKDIFRNALRDNGKVLAHDMPTARDLWRNKMRKVRKPLLEALDVAYQRADEDNNIKAKLDAAQSKRALRDVTADPAIEAAQTVDELKAVWPDILK